MTENELSGDTQKARSPTKVLRHALVCAAVVLALCLVLTAPAGAWGADTSWYDTNPGADEYVISTADELAGLAVIANGNSMDGVTIKLGADIDLASQEWTPINFRGSGAIFEGQGHTISNISIHNQGLSHCGLFGSIASSVTVSNVTLRDVNILGDYFVGAFAGYLSDENWYDGRVESPHIINCSVIGGTVEGDQQVGGFIGGASSGSQISYCTSNVTVIGNFAVGGLIGDGGGDIQSCIVTSSITGNNAVGGMIGYAGENVQISSSCAVSSVESSGSWTGGLVGRFGNGNITDCYAGSILSANGYVGGIVGDVYHNVNITNSYSIGLITAENSYAFDSDNGGIIGSSGTEGNITITNSVALMQSVDGTSPTGRLTGYADAVIVNSYAWENMTNHGAYFSEGGMNGTSVSASQFWNNQAFFEDTLGWDFENTWKMNAGNANAQLPVLQIQETPVAGDASYLLDSALIPELKDTYIVGIDADYWPFTKIDNNGDPVGFDVESIQWIAKQQGFNVIIQPTDWNGIIPALNAGLIDMIYSGMSITPERADNVTFSNPYWDVGYSIVVRSEDSSVQVDDFLHGNKGIGVARNSIGDAWIQYELGTESYEGMIKNGSIKLYNNVYSAIVALENGLVDAVIHDSYEVSDYLEGTSNLCVIQSSVIEQYAVAMRKDDTALHEVINDGIAKLKSSGKWDELAAKYMGDSSSNPTPTPSPVEEITVTSAEELAAVLGADVSENVVTLTHDVTLNQSISLEIDGEVILTTSGDYTIYRGVENTSLFHIKRPTILTMKGKDAGNQLTIDGRKDVYTENTEALVMLYIDGTLNLSEYSVLTNNVVNNGHGSGVDVRAVAATVYINGGSITENDAVGRYGYGGGINTYGRVVMNSGSISNNTAVSMGGGVHVASPGSFEMNGGEISHNYAPTGGGVDVDGESVTYDSTGLVIDVDYGYFNMSGGSISGNTGDSTPGIFNYGIITISGGEICNHSGFAVNSGGGDVILTGGTFRGNTYAVYLFDGSTGTYNDNDELIWWNSSGKLSISGDAMLPASETVSVNDNSTIRVTGPLSANAGVYNIKTNKESGVVVDAISAGISGEDLLSHFTLSEYGYSLAADGYTLVLSSSGSDPGNTPDIALTPDINWYDAGDSEYFIDNANELAGLAELVNTGTDSFDGKTIYLTGDIDLNGINWTPIGSVMYDTVFSGKFDGNDHVIYNLTISDYRTPAGLFGYVDDAEIYNVNLVDVSISAESYVGGLVGYMHFSDVSNCHVSGSISGGWDVGGIVGHAEYTNNIDACTVKNSYINAINASMGDVGGIAGYVYDRTHVSNCTVGDTAIYGTVGIDVGGIAGSVGCDSSVKNCIVEFCNLNGDDYSCVGGIAGALGGSSYLDTSSVSSVNVTHGSSVGGLVGDIYEGYVAYSAVHDTDVCDGTYVGGLVGQISNGGVNYCLVTGSVSGNHYTGGIVGFSSSSGIHYSIALVEFVDGIITSRLGYPSSGSEYSYDYAWVSMTSSGELFTTDISTSAHNGESVSSTIFWNNQSFFEENLFFDFGEMWTMNSGNENYQLPVLKFQCTPVTGDATYLLESEPATPSLTLVNGWNFVSVPKALDASCNTAYKLFGSVDTGGAAVLEYNASSQSWEQITANTVIKPLSAYWIYSKTAVTIPLTYFDGPNSPATKSLYPGWNAVGLSAATETAASSFFAGLDWRVAVPWNGETGRYDIAIINGSSSAVNSPDRLLTLGSGCWLYVEEANVLPGLTA